VPKQQSAWATGLLSGMAGNELPTVLQKSR
jgi:hypothetical protein